MHRNRLTHGTIGRDIDTARREHTVREAQALVNMIREALDLPENISLRRLGNQAGLSKDLLWNIRRANFPHVRSVAWESLQEALANALYAKAHAARRPATAA